MCQATFLFDQYAQPKEAIWDFSLSYEQKMVQQTVRTFVERELMPLEREVMQSEGKYPTGIEPTLYKSLQQKAKDVGFWGINTPYEGTDEIQHFIIARALLKGYVKIGTWE